MKNLYSAFSIVLLLGTGNLVYAQLDPAKMPNNASMTTNMPVQMTASGLGYTVLQAGQGAKVGKNDEVEIRFISYDHNGEVQDGTLNHVPVIVPVSEMFTGLQESLTLMQAGGIYELHIPAHLGYQEEGQRTKKAIRYRVEVLRINP